ncbi:MAG: GlsB/YeaQ/YmgE family stress response membrane protein [candidate division NC10 bacterium]
MGILAWIVFGLIAGALAKFIMPGKDPGGHIVTILIGIAGAVLGGFLGSYLGFGGVSGFDLRSMGIAIVGALLLLWLYRMMKKT